MIEHRIELYARDENGMIDFGLIESELNAHGVEGKKSDFIAMTIFEKGACKIPMWASLWNVPKGNYMPDMPLHCKEYVAVRAHWDDFLRRDLIHEYEAWWDSDGLRSMSGTACERMDGERFNRADKALEVDRKGKPLKRLCPRCYQVYPVKGYGTVGYCSLRKSIDCALCVNRIPHAARRSRSALISDL